jgi:hypothetical protein
LQRLQGLSRLQRIRQYRQLGGLVSIVSITVALGPPESRRLVTYVVPSSEGSTTDLRAALRDRLPSYLVPDSVGDGAAGLENLRYGLQRCGENRQSGRSGRV